MEHFAGLDVSVKETSVCIVDDTGKIVREAKIASEPDALLQALSKPGYCFKRIGLEAGPLSQWLFSALAEAVLPVICVETRHMRAALKADIDVGCGNGAFTEVLAAQIRMAYPTICLGRAALSSAAPTTAEAREPASTPILTASCISGVLNARSPMKRLIVNPIPHSTATP